MYLIEFKLITTVILVYDTNTEEMLAFQVIIKRRSGDRENITRPRVDMNLLFEVFSSTSSHSIPEYFRVRNVAMAVLLTGVYINSKK